jgi:formate hydrogenlyase subunit 3/multisubunit Na+/H+ antiporter MnhD subunit
MLQRHLKRLLAFSTVSHAGFLLAGLIVPGATAGTLMYLAGHGLIKGALFLCVGILLHRLPRHVQDALHPLSILRRLHSGYIGDYVAWFMVGATALLVALAVPGRPL